MISTRHPNIPSSAWSVIKGLEAHPLVESIILFGSRAIGDEDDESDVDLAVCGVTITPHDWTEIRLAVEEAPTLYQFTLVYFEGCPQNLRDRIMATGVKLYDRPKAA